ncbi:protein of unknown function [Marinospirillum celere]|uniref:Uncharacterized protein n=1 Tax=Marinospirillum celere TaxID=1122252 RepID=A0A1I1IYE5_9GAMM|nr:DUF4105 domain-containing protein [Marinospirillum celere]SFC38703.1 protein of unknown function [Marinospirillum celere]
MEMADSSPPFFMMITKIIFFSFLFFLSIQAYADDKSVENLWGQAMELALYQKSTWLRLLHQDPHGKPESKVVSSEFFLSDRGNIDPRSEMETLIDKYELLYSQGKEQDILCKFPARFLWLSQYLDIPGYSNKQQGCERFLSWAKPDEIESISILLVSGYFGNPASTFGHSLLRVNTEEGGRLLDLTFNFGAMVPEDELTAVYIYKGLTGRYLSGFSDGHFYSQDLVYSRTEYRDIWDYQLELDDFSARLMMAHLWEVHGNKFNYYFLTENCAYRIAELLTLVTEDERYINNSVLWYSPVEMFHKVRDADQENSIIKEVVYHPSFQRIFLAKYNQLDIYERSALDSWIRGDTSAFEKLDENARIHILSVLLSYYEYLLSAQNSDEKEAYLKEKRRQVIYSRIQLPANTSLRFEPPDDLPSPAEGTRPMRFAFGVAGSDEISSLVLRWSPFYLDKVGKNSLEGGELVVFDFDLRYEGGRGGYLSKLEFIRIRNMVTSRHIAPGESFYAWHLKTGVNGKDQGLEFYDPYFTGGLFRAYDYFDGLFMFGMDLHVTLQGEPLELEPLIGLRKSFGDLNAWLQLGQRYALESDSWNPAVEVNASRAFTKSFGVTSQLRYTGDVDAALTLDYFW